MKFTDILSELGVPFRTEGHTHCRPGWAQLDCIHCSPGWQHFRMGYNLRGRYIHCWACGKHGLTETLQLLSGWSWAKCKELLGDVERGPAPTEIPRGRYVPPVGVSSLQDAHRRYLKGRGYDPPSLEALWRLGAIGIAPRLQWRVFIPIAFRGELVSWTTRSISDRHDSRYRSASPAEESVNHKSLLYGEDMVRHGVIVHEGPFDVWRTGPGAVATLGTGFTQAQARKIAKYPVRIIVFDNTPEGRQRAGELASALEVFPGRTTVVHIDAKDMAEASEQEVRAVRRLIR